MDTSSGHQKASVQRIAHHSSELLRRGFTDITTLWTVDDFAMLKVEAKRLIQNFGKRRDLTIESTGGTPRRMTNVSSEAIRKNSALFQKQYESESLRLVLESLVRESVFPCPYLPEQMIITQMHRRYDTHGWHWDDYSIAVVLILEAPATSAGGFLQSVYPTSWNKCHPDVASQFISNPTISSHFSSASAYAMLTRKTLHRVYPILHDGAVRIIANFGYAIKSDLQGEISHETVETLWS